MLRPIDGTADIQSPVEGITILNLDRIARVGADQITRKMKVSSLSER